MFLSIRSLVVLTVVAAGAVVFLVAAAIQIEHAQARSLLPVAHDSSAIAAAH